MIVKSRAEHLILRKGREILNTVKIIDNWTEFAESGLHNLVVALGNFDGVHLGHRQLITEAVQKAHEISGQAAVLTFNPHPQQLLAPERFSKLLTSINQRLHRFAQLGVDIVILLPFTHELASLSPKEFAQEILVSKMGVNHVYVGFNYSFGRGGRGGPNELLNLGSELGFAVTVVEPTKINGKIVSSTLIREALEQGNIEEAYGFLGSWPAIEGIVVSGDRIGRTIGFPTANVATADEQLLPARGVYAAWVAIDGVNWPAMVNIGLRPTFKSWEKPTVEAHIFDFSADIYDTKVEVIFRRRLRDEQKFSEVSALIRQLNLDCVAAQTVLSGSGNESGHSQYPRG